MIGAKVHTTADLNFHSFHRCSKQRLGPGLRLQLAVWPLSSARNDHHLRFFLERVRLEPADINRIGDA